MDHPQISVLLCTSNNSPQKKVHEDVLQKKMSGTKIANFSKNDSRRQFSNKIERWIILRYLSCSVRPTSLLKKMFVRIFCKKKILEQSFPKFTRNESQYQLTNKSRERYLFCSVPPTSIHTIIPIIAVINILDINICTLSPGPRNRLPRLPW